MMGQSTGEQILCSPPPDRRRPAGGSAAPSRPTTGQASAGASASGSRPNTSQALAGANSLHLMRERSPPGSARGGRSSALTSAGADVLGSDGTRPVVPSDPLGFSRAWRGPLGSARRDESSAGPEGNEGLGLRALPDGSAFLAGAATSGAATSGAATSGAASSGKRGFVPPIDTAIGDDVAAGPLSTISTCSLNSLSPTLDKLEGDRNRSKKMLALFKNSTRAVQALNAFRDPATRSSASNAPGGSQAVPAWVAAGVEVSTSAGRRGTIISKPGWDESSITAAISISSPKRANRSPQRLHADLSSEPEPMQMASEPSDEEQWMIQWEDSAVPEPITNWSGIAQAAPSWVAEGVEVSNIVGRRGVVASKASGEEPWKIQWEDSAAPEPAMDWSGIFQVGGGGGVPYVGVCSPASAIMAGGAGAADAESMDAGPARTRRRRPSGNASLLKPHEVSSDDAGKNVTGLSVRGGASRSTSPNPNSARGRAKKLSPPGSRNRSESASRATAGSAKAVTAEEIDPPDSPGGFINEDDIDIDKFMEELFVEYAMTKDNKGNPMMNNMHVRRFFGDFAIGDAHKVVSLADVCYADELERQGDMNFRFDLSKAEAKRGLCFKSFCCLLDQVYPRGSSRAVARQRFIEYAGDAHAMKMNLSG